MGRTKEVAGVGLKRWRLVSTTRDGSFKVFDLRIDKALSPRTHRVYEFYVLESNPWVNVIPITKDNQVVFVRQYRHGIRDFTLEIPGGLVEDSDSPEEAAMRELFEETGYRGRVVEFIGKVHPNPAILNNECYTYLISEVEKVGTQHLDEREDIEVVTYPLAKVGEMIKEGEITHSLVICAFSFLFLSHPELFKL